MTVGQLAALLSAAGFLILVGLLAYPLVMLGKVFDETRLTVRGVSESTLPLLSEVTTTVATTNQQLAKVDGITTNAAQVATNVSALTTLFAATLGSPVVKVAAFSYGVRQAIRGRRGRGRRGRD